MTLHAAARRVETANGFRLIVECLPMADDSQPGARYWSLVEPVWRSISIYADPDEFQRQYQSVRPAVGHLFAAHWCQSEVRNGGFHQFFSNATGVLAPEAEEGFRTIGLNEWADLLAEAIRFFGPEYPRDQATRQELLSEQAEQLRSDWDPFCSLDKRFYSWLHAEPDRWERAADRYATSTEG